MGDPLQPGTSFADGPPPFFASQEEHEGFLEHYCRQQPFSWPVPPPRLAAMISDLEGVSPEILFDRATRKKEKPNLTLDRFPNAGRPQLLRGRNAARLAARQYRDEGLAIEISAPTEMERVDRFLKEFRDALKTPIGRLEPSLLVFPHGFKFAGEFTGQDVFLIPLTGSARLSFVGHDGSRVGEGRGAMNYLPRGAHFETSTEGDSILLKISVVVPNALGLIGQYLSKKLGSETRWKEPLWGLFAPGGSGRASRDKLDRLMADLRHELQSCSGENIARGWHQPAGTPSTQPPAEYKPASARPLYEDSQWLARGIERRPDDIHIVTFKRSGTTWMQMILYQILTKGDLDQIGHIFEFSPYPSVELRILGGSDRMDRLPSPRVIKTHLPYGEIYSPQGKFIYVAREGLDVAISGFHHSLELNQGQVTFDVYFDRFLSERPGWFEHVEEWWANRRHPNVFFLTYRELKEDLAGSIVKVAKFCGVELTPEKLAVAVEKCGFDYMKRHEAKFHHLAGVQWLLSQESHTGFIRKGGIATERGTLSQIQRERFEAKYRQKLGHLEIKLDQ